MKAAWRDGSQRKAVSNPTPTSNKHQITGILLHRLVFIGITFKEIDLRKEGKKTILACQHLLTLDETQYTMFLLAYTHTSKIDNIVTFLIFYYFVLVCDTRQRTSSVARGEIARSSGQCCPQVIRHSLGQDSGLPPLPPAPQWMYTTQYMPNNAPQWLVHQTLHPGLQTLQWWPVAMYNMTYQTW